ncbi:hypothetical protein QTH97_02285 [Variovorax sp. J22R24]|uniref:hypothetical protein n=1 Tax=Variovorax gracilis TaxID=3053502 RepID=UPI0025778529|nr:hypothetical protein [Variovorax sp. J22R24]MDM0103745.1 hypothetical protein [Variovorax sp. J22R24]
MKYVNRTPISKAEFERDIRKPGLLERIKRMPPEVQTQYLAELSHMQRAEEGMRWRPDLLPNGNSYRPSEPTVANRHGYPTPFAPKETHRPDHLADPEFMKHAQGVTQQFVTEQLTSEMQERMGTDADCPLPKEATLREQIEAAAAIHSQE